MTDDRAPGAFRPRLPDDPAYWNALAGRITHSVEPVFAELQAQRAWWRPLDRFGPALTVGAIAAVAATFVALPAPEWPAAPVPAAVTDPTPADLLGNAFTTPEAPDVMALIALGNEEQP